MTETLKKVKLFWQRIFSRERNTLREALMEFSKTLMLIVDLEQLKENIVGKIKELAQVDKIMIVLLDTETEHFRVVESRGYPKSKTSKIIFSDEDHLIRWLVVNETFLEIKNSPGILDFLSRNEREVLSDLDVELIFPLITMNRITGMVLLGNKIDKTGFTQGEVELLSMLFSQAALAFENAYLYNQQVTRLRRMYRADRLAILGQLAAGAAHEIRNPLTSIRSTIQYLQKDLDGDESKEIVIGILDEVDRINDIIHGLLSFAKPSKPQFEEVDLNLLLEQSTALIQTAARKQGVTIRLEIPDRTLTVNVDPALLKQVFLNVLMNSLQAMSQGGYLGVSLTQIRSDSTLGNDSKAMNYLIEFKDTGSGIAESDLDRVFDPFFTTKKEGTGLGLSISYGIIQQHGGQIEVNNYAEGGKTGARVLIRLA